MIKEFKEFISRGNVMDMAVGVILASSFGAIVTSLVNDIIMPIIGIILGGINFTDLKYVITPANEAEGIVESAINYGNFIQLIVNFIIIAFCIFLVVKGINKMRKPAPEAEATTKTCPYCKEEVALDATKCPHCTSELK